MTRADLRSARRELGLSQAELAERLRLGSDGGRTIRRWEAGDRTIPGPVEVAVGYMLAEHRATNTP